MRRKKKKKKKKKKESRRTKKISDKIWIEKLFPGANTCFVDS
jgi:hypothetical protein